MSQKYGNDNDVTATRMVRIPALSTVAFLSYITVALDLDGERRPDTLEPHDPLCGCYGGTIIGLNG